MLTSLPHLFVVVYDDTEETAGELRLKPSSKSASLSSSAVGAVHRLVTMLSVLGQGWAKLCFSLSISTDFGTLEVEGGVTVTAAVVQKRVWTR